MKLVKENVTYTQGRAFAGDKVKLGGRNSDVPDCTVCKLSMHYTCKMLQCVQLALCIRDCSQLSSTFYISCSNKKASFLPRCRLQWLSECWSYQRCIRQSFPYRGITPCHPRFKTINLLKPTGHVMHQQFNIQQLYVLPTLYLCVLYLSENKQRLVPLIS